MSEPYFNDEEIANEFYYRIGRIVVAWSAVERSVDNMLFMSNIFHPKTGKAMFAWTKRTKALRALLEANPNLDKKWISKTIEKLDKMGAFRNGIIHGYCSGMLNSEPPRILFRAARYHSDEIELEQLTPSLADLSEFLNNVRKIEEELIPLSIGIAMGPKPKSGKDG